MYIPERVYNDTADFGLNDRKGLLFAIFFGNLRKIKNRLVSPEKGTLSRQSLD